MNTSTTVTIAFVGLIVYTMLTKKAALSSLYFYPSSVKNIRLDGITPVMTVGLMVQNTSNQKFIVRSLAGEVSSNGYLIGNMSSFMQQTVQPNSQYEFRIEVRLSPLGIVNDIIRAFQDGNFTMDIKVNARINIDNYQVPLLLNYKVGA